VKPPVGDPRRDAPGSQNGNRSSWEGRRPPIRPPVRRFELAGVRPAALFGLVAAVLVPVVIVAVLVIGIGGSKSGGSKAGGSKAGASMSPSRMASAKRPGPVPVNLPLTAKTVAHYPLAKAVAGINVSVTAKGMLPLSSCKLTNSTTVTCMQPTPAVDIVIFRTYRSLPALYAAYEARVSQLAQGPFRANFGNCTETMTNGEIGWNHDFKHPSMYPMSEFTSGQITDDKAAGRVYCTFDDSDLYLVWTQDDGRVLGELSGAPHVDAYVWCRQVHHSIVIPGTPNMMAAMMGPTSSHTATSTTSSTSTTSTASMSGRQSNSSTTSTQGMK
jgi:hypothetical protein